MNFRKPISWLLIFFFTATNLSAGIPTAEIAVPERFSKFMGDKEEIRLPAEIGRIVSRREGKLPLVIHIQDAHAHFEAQMHIKRMLEELTARHGVRLIGLEGASGNLKPEQFRLFGVKEADSAAAEALVKQGELTGAEYFAIQNERKDIEWMGVEDSALYLKDLEVYQSVLKDWEKYQGFFEKFRAELGKMKSKALGVDLRKFDGKKEDFEEKRLSLFQYGRSLQSAAKKYLKRDLGDNKEQKDYPNLVRVSALAKTESELKKAMTRFEEERKDLLSFLEKEYKGAEKDFLTGGLRKLEKENWDLEVPARYYFETLYGALRKMSVAFEKRYPAFRLYSKYIILQDELDSKELFEEIAGIEQLIYKELETNHVEKGLIQLSKDVRFLETFLKLELSKEDHRSYEARRTELTPSSLVKRLGVEAWDSSILDEAVIRAGNFYRLAQDRESFFVSRLIRRAKEKNEKVVVLVTGGFHTEGVAKLLDESKVAHMTVTPKLSRVEESGAYHRVIMNENTVLEEKYSNTRMTSSSQIVAALKTAAPELYAAMNPADPSRPEKVALGSLAEALSALAMKLLQEKPELKTQAKALVDELNRYLERLKQNSLVADNSVKLVLVAGESGGELTILPSNRLLQQGFPKRLVQRVDLSGRAAASETETLFSAASMGLEIPQMPFGAQSGYLSAPEHGPGGIDEAIRLTLLRDLSDPEESHMKTILIPKALIQEAVTQLKQVVSAEQFSKHKNLGSKLDQILGKGLKAYLIRPEAPVYSSRKVTGIVVNGGNSYSFSHYSKKNNAIYIAGRLFDQLEELKLKGGEEGRSAAAQQVALVTRQLALLAGVSFRDASEMNAAIAGPSASGVGSRLGDTILHAVQADLQDIPQTILRIVENDAASVKTDLGRGYMQTELSEDLVKRLHLEKAMGEVSNDGDRYYLIQNQENIFFTKYNEKTQRLVIEPFFEVPVSQEGDYLFSDFLSYAGLLVNSQKGKGVVVTIHKADNYRAYFVNSADSERRATAPNVKDRSVNLGKLTGTKSWYGGRYGVPVDFQFEYKSQGDTAGERPMLLTGIPNDKIGANKGFNAIIQPSYTVAIVGFGTIGSRVHAARKSGFKVVAVQRSPSPNAQTAQQVGVPVYALKLDEKAKADFQKAGIAVSGEFEADLLQKGLVDVVVDATNPPKGAKVTPAEEMKEKVYSKYPVKAIYQGGEEPTIGKFFDVNTLLTLGKDFSEFTSEETKDIFCPSCNTTAQGMVVDAISNVVAKGSLKIRAITYRRAQDPGSGEPGLVPDGVVLDTTYHHAEDVEVGRLNTRLLDAFSRGGTGEIEYTTAAGQSHITKFHVTVMNVSAKKLNEAGQEVPFTAEDAKRELSKLSRIALVKYPKDKPNTSILISIIEKYGMNNVYVPVVQVMSERDGSVVITIVNPQETVVIPNNIDAIQAATGTFTPENAHKWTNILLGVNDIRETIETTIPLKSDRVKGAAQSLGAEPQLEERLRSEISPEVLKGLAELSKIVFTDVRALASHMDYALQEQLTRLGQAEPAEKDHFDNIMDMIDVSDIVERHRSAILKAAASEQARGEFFKNYASVYKDTDLGLLLGKEMLEAMSQDVYSYLPVAVRAYFDVLDFYGSEYSHFKQLNKNKAPQDWTSDFEANVLKYLTLAYTIKMTKSAQSLGEEEKKNAMVVAEKLHELLSSGGDPELAKRFLRGGYNQEGYGVAEGAAIDGSHAFQGDQGYYTRSGKGVETGKQIYLNTVRAMADFFKRREERNGKPVRLILKPGIGGQHTPFQGIADVFHVTDPTNARITGEFELGKNFEQSMAETLKTLSADWDQVAVIPSSKSGSTDETMMIFSEIFAVLLKNISIKKGLNGAIFTTIVFDTLNEVNFDANGKERPAADLFKLDPAKFGTNSLIELIANRANAKGLTVSAEQVQSIFGTVLGNMFFETTDRPDQSRLSAFVRNSGLDKELGPDAPGFGAMFDNVGGRWTADLHMMTFLAYHGLNAEAYWNARRQGIEKVLAGSHSGNDLGNLVLDEGITDVALVLPDSFFWFGKSIEQNFNESIWQKGFLNVVTIKRSQWEAQKANYANQPNRLVINATDLQMSDAQFRLFELGLPGLSGFNDETMAKQKIDGESLAKVFASLSTIFYGMTNTVGNRLIARAVKAAGYQVSDIDINDLNNPATKVLQENLYLRQPYVELGKNLLESRLNGLQQREKEKPGTIQLEFEKAKQLAHARVLETNVPGVESEALLDADAVAKKIQAALEHARATGRKLVPFIYLEGEKFNTIRNVLTEMGIEWVMQGTSDQHISYQQVLAQPQKYLPFMISFIPEKEQRGRPAIGFAKGYLNRVSPNMVRDLFAEASYQALTEKRKDQGGQGFFLRLTDNNDERTLLIDAFGRAKQAIGKQGTASNPKLPLGTRPSLGLAAPEHGPGGIDEAIRGTLFRPGLTPDDLAEAQVPQNVIDEAFNQLKGILSTKDYETYKTVAESLDELQGQVKGYLVRPDAPAFSPRKVTGIVVNGGNSYSFSHYSKKNNAVYVAGRLFDQLEEIRLKGGEEGKAAAAQQVALVARQIALLAGVTFSDSNRINILIAGPSLAGVGSRLGDALLRAVKSDLDEIPRSIVETVNADAGAVKKDIGRGYVQTELTPDLANELNLEAAFGEKTKAGDRYYLIQSDSNMFFSRYNEKTQRLVIEPIFEIPVSQEGDFLFSDFLSYAGLLVNSQKGKGVVVTIHKADNYRAYFMNPADSERRETAPNVKDRSLNVGNLNGTKSWYGGRYGVPVDFQFEYNFEDVEQEERPFLLTTIASDQIGAIKGFNAIIQPSYTVAIVGFGTIGSRVHAARKSGFKVVAVQRSASPNAQNAQQVGVPVYALKLDEKAKADFQKAGIAVSGEFEADLLQKGLVDVVVDATNPPKGAKVTPAEEMKEKVYSKYPVKAIYQGGEEPTIGKFFDVNTILTLGKDFSEFSGEETKDIFCPSCNTTAQGMVVDAIANVAAKGSLRIRAQTLRRAQDPGSGESGLVPDGVLLDTTYHHAEDVEVGRLNTRLLDAFSRGGTGEIAYTTSAGQSHITKFHVTTMNVDAKKVNEEGQEVLLTAEDVRKELSKLSRIALVKYPKDKLNTSILISIIEKYGMNNVYVPVVQVMAERDGSVVITIVNPQETVVIPNNIDAIQAATGTFTPENAHKWTNILLGVNDIRETIETTIPLKSDRVKASSLGEAQDVRQALEEVFPAAPLAIRTKLEQVLGAVAEIQTDEVSHKRISFAIYEYLIRSGMLTAENGEDVLTRVAAAIQFIVEKGADPKTNLSEFDNLIVLETLIQKAVLNEWNYAEVLTRLQDILPAFPFKKDGNYRTELYLALKDFLDSKILSENNYGVTFQTFSELLNAVLVLDAKDIEGAFTALRYIFNSPAFQKLSGEEQTKQLFAARDIVEGQKERAIHELYSLYYAIQNLPEADLSQLTQVSDALKTRPGYAGTLYQVPQKGTDRLGQEGKATLRIFEIFELGLTLEEQQEVLRQIQENPDKHVLLLKPEVIERAAGGAVDVVLTEDMGIIPKNFIGKTVKLGDNSPAILGKAASDKLSDLPESGSVRLSPANLFRIKIDGMYLLSFNQNRLKKGKLSLTPIGGAYDFDSAAGKANYAKLMTMTPEDAKKPLEMRQTVARKDVDKFVELFNRGLGRELSPLRELDEELVGEESVFPSIPENARYLVIDTFKTPEALYQALKTAVEKRAEENGFKFDLDLLDKAFALISEKHKGVIRDDNRAYVFHPLEIAYHLVNDLGIADQDTVLATLTHDLPEDTDVTLDQIGALFGEGVKTIVSDLTENVSYRKDKTLVYSSPVTGQEYTGRLATKIEHLDRVQGNGNTASILIKVADRLHNLRTNEHPNNVTPRRMPLAEIDRWYTFLQDPAAPDFLKNEILPALNRMREKSEKLEPVSGTPKASSLGTEDQIRKALAVQGSGRDFQDADGVNRNVTGRIYERDEVLGALWQTLYFTEGTEALDLAAIRAEHALYEAGLPDSLYKASYQAEGEFAVLATTSEYVSIESVKRQLEVNPLALVVLLYTGDLKKRDAYFGKVKQQLGPLTERLIFIEAASSQVSEVFNDLLTGKKKELANLARGLFPEFNFSNLAKHTAFFASEEQLAGIALSPATKLVAPEKGELDKELDAVNLSAKEFNLFGTTAAFLVARKGGDFEKLSREVPDINQGLTKGGGMNQYGFNINGLSGLISQFVNEFQGFQAILRAA